MFCNLINIAILTTMKTDHQCSIISIVFPIVLSRLISATATSSLSGHGIKSEGSGFEISG